MTHVGADCCPVFCGRFDTMQDKAFASRMQSQLRSYERASAERRSKILDNINARIKKRQELFETGEKNWKTNQRDKKSRQVRDLNFELALRAKQSKLREDDNYYHQIDQESGIDNFEINLKRNGIGGDVDEDGTLLPSSEDNTVFMNRLELNASRDWPTDGEVGDFKQVLEKRTKELRIARAEKARRKRRMQVDQDKALANMEEQTVEDDISAPNSVIDDELKATRKQKDYEERTATAKIKYAEIMDAGEEKIRIFAEQARMKDFDEGGRVEKFRATVSAQTKRYAEKKTRNYEMCKLVVQQLVNELFATGANAQGLQTKGDDKYDENIPNSELVVSLLDLALQSPLIDNNDYALSKRALSSRVPDLWLSAVNLANNVGRWKLDNNSTYSRIASFSEDSVEVLSELLKYLKAEGICPFSIDASEYFVHHHEFMKLAEEQARMNAENAKEESEDDVEPYVTPPRPQYVCMVLGDKNCVSAQTWPLTVDWMGGKDNVFLICIDDAVDFAFEMYSAAIPDGKDTPQDDLITFEVLCRMFGVSSQSLADSQNLDVDSVQSTLAGVVMFFQTTSTISEIIAFVNRFKEAKSLLPDDNSVSPISTLELSSFEFNDVSLTIVAAQILWLRDFVSRQIFLLFNVQPFTQHVLFVSTRGVASDRWVTVKVFDWFLKGGSRHNIPDDDSDLKAEINAEMATEKPKKGKGAAKKKDKKDKSEPVVFEESMIRSVIWAHNEILSENCENIEGEDEYSTERVDDIVADQQPEDEKEIHHEIEFYDQNLSLESKLLQLYRGIWDLKWESVEAEERRLRSKSQLESLDTFSKEANCPLHFFSLNENLTDENYSNFLIAHDYSILENLVALFVVDLLEHGADNGNDEDAESVQSMQSQEQPLSNPSMLSHNKSLKLVNERKNNLTISQKLWRAIKLKELTLDMDEISSILNKCRRQSLICEERVGSLLLAILVKLDCVRKELSYERARAIKSMKTEDAGWKDHCMQFRDNLVILANENAKSTISDIQSVFSSAVRELNCDLGDIIDARHLEWLKFVKNQESAFFNIVNDATATCLDITYCFREIILTILKRNIEVSLSISSLISDEKGESQLSLKSANVPPATVEAIQNCIIKEVELLHQQIIPIDNNGLESDFFVDKWMEMFSEIGSITANAEFSVTSAAQSVIYEVKYELLKTFLCIVKGFNACIASLKKTTDQLIQILNCFVQSRNSYEHHMLQSWIAELYQTRQNKNSDDPLSAPIQFISTYFFGVSDDPDLDKVPQTSFLHRGLVDVEDMWLEPKTLRCLAYYVVKVRQELEFKDLSVFETLKAIVKNAIENGEALPNSWRNVKRLQALYDSVLESCGDYSLSENIDLFFQHMMMKLSLGYLECAPTSAYIVKLGLKIFTNTEDLSKSEFLSGEEERIIDLSRISTAVKQDKVLKLGWWNTNLKGAQLKDHTSTVVDILESIALMCCTSITPISFSPSDNGIDVAYVRFDTFVVLLTKNFKPVYDELKALQKVLL